MINVIYKYELAASETQLLYMPKEAKILSVQNQHEEVQLWAEVVLGTPTVTVARKILIVPTGLEFMDPSESRTFVGTVQLRGGQLVFHVFDCGELEE